MERQSVAVNDLRLWESNPRVEQAKTQAEEIERIYNEGSAASQETSRRYMKNILESIATQGFQAEIHPVLCSEESSEITVRDGNRRVAALKILNDPEKYSDILSPAHLKAVRKLCENHGDNIPDEIEVVVYSQDEEGQLEAALSRIHDGANDGVGTVPWSTAAKGRFFEKNEFSDKFDAPFEEQFGCTLTSYLGGSKAITTRQRIFGYQSVKSYLYPDGETQSITPDILDKIKTLADAVKEYADGKEVPLSRLKASAVKEIINKLSDNTVPAGESPDESFETGSSDGERGSVEAPDSNQSPEVGASLTRLTFADFGKQIVEVKNSQLGGKYLKESYLDLDEDCFENLNLLLAALAKFGRMAGSKEDRFLQGWILSPAIRSIFELSLLALQRKGLFDKAKGVASHHQDNVRDIIDQMTQNDFMTFLAQPNRYDCFSGYKEVQSILGGTDFAKAIEVSMLTAHKAGRSVNEQQIYSAFETAVLFAVLSQAYIQFAAQKVAP